MPASTAEEIAKQSSKSFYPPGEQFGKVGA